MTAPLFDVVYVPTGHVSLRAVPHSAAMSAADSWNRACAGQRGPWKYRVYPTGTFEA